jgi:hypothetical protein
VRFDGVGGASAIVGDQRGLGSGLVLQHALSTAVPLPPSLLLLDRRLNVAKQDLAPCVTNAL